MKTLRPMLAAAVLAAALPASAGSSGAMSNVYLLAHAGAILEACLASPEAGVFPEAKTRELGELGSRLAEVVRSMGTYTRDDELVLVYESTKAHIAGDTRLKFHVKNNHQNCGERTLGDMRAYVARNETLIGHFLERKRLESAGAKKR